MRVDDTRRGPAGPNVGTSNDWSWISSSFTTPEMPSLTPLGAICDRPGAVDADGCRAELPHATACAGDRVDLLDEADRATFFARGLAQRLEVVADLAAGLAVVHRLERGRRDEEVRHARFSRHGLRHVGLAGAGRPFEQDRLARVAAHLLAERLVREEQVERLDDLVLHRTEPDDVVERRRRSRSPRSARAANDPPRRSGTTSTTAISDDQRRSARASGCRPA